MPTKTKRTGLVTLVVVGFLLAGVRSEAASWIVWPGQSLQAAITNAIAGDNITIKEGIYVENITLTKGLDIRGEAGKENTTSVQGTWTIQNAVSPIYLKGFKIGVSTSGNVTITNCTDVRVDYVTANPSALSVAGTKFYLYRSSFSGDAAFNGGNVTVQKSAIGGNLTSDNVDTKLLASTVTSNVSHNTFAKDCTVFQSTVGEQLYVNATNYWIGYNTIRYANVQNGNGTCEIVGNRFSGRNAAYNGLTLANTSPNIRNNVISGYTYYNHIADNNNSPTVSNLCHGIVVTSGNPVIVNNVIQVSVDVNNSGTFNQGGTIYNRDFYVTCCANGVYVLSGNARIENCIISASAVSDAGLTTSGNAVQAGASVDVKYCNSFGSTSLFGGGVNPTNCISGNPLFAGDYVLNPSSPSIDSGDPDLQYSDLDSTRNDMGCWGGHAFDPDGRTTTNPVVMATSASPLYVKRGQNVMLKARGAVAAP